MKITKKYLQDLIKEEVANILRESNLPVKGSEWPWQLNWTALDRASYWNRWRHKADGPVLSKDTDPKVIKRLFDKWTEDPNGRYDRRFYRPVEMLAEFFPELNLNPKTAWGKTRPFQRKLKIAKRAGKKRQLQQQRRQQAKKLADEIAAAAESKKIRKEALRRTIERFAKKLGIISVPLLVVSLADKAAAKDYAGMADEIIASSPVGIPYEFAKVFGKVLKSNLEKSGLEGAASASRSKTSMLDQL